MNARASAQELPPTGSRPRRRGVGLGSGERGLDGVALKPEAGADRLGVGELAVEVGQIARRRGGSGDI
ncbi:hypothetical protein STRCI_008574 [Streptomyces cinnabarinus]|uniref:Uncharacterized protein n=1 Tax=Streptomyces cinnabarinus TaxID=67287 RepID=A0ABY7KV90_9ACTN|nr:hypothetical protein [Streptomyces cinnabarinus]WAZ26901.1 hypothetical protein STRCI_008574 [Streptomyces cinnabarinus]